MKEINSEYDSLSKALAKGLKFQESELNFNDLFKEKIEILVKMQGIIIEIIGNWIWVTINNKNKR